MPLTHHDFAVVQAFGVLLKLHPDGVVDLVVPEGAQGLGLKLVAVLHDDFSLMQVVGNLPGGKVDICKVKRLQAVFLLCGDLF